MFLWRHKWKLVTALLLLLLAAVVTCFKPADTSAWIGQEFYKEQIAAVNHALLYRQPATDTMSFMAGWARVNLQPPFNTPIAIDAHRKGKHFTGVHDSLYIRALVFKKGNTKVAYVAADLLIVPPTVWRVMDTLLRQQGFSNTNIYYTATHTHTSIGGWYNSYVGEIFAGKYDARVPQHIARTMAQAIMQAENNLSPAQTGSLAIPADRLVVNRLVHEKGTVDSLLHLFKIKKQIGEEALLINFTAHATCFHESLMQLSGDWPGLLQQRMAAQIPALFTAFSAGAVGSHGPFPYSSNQYTQAAYMAQGVAETALLYKDSVKLQVPGRLQLFQVPLYLREPNLRITQHIALRPWLFKKLFGDEQVGLSVLQIGSHVFAGTPCDFSGELTAPLYKTAKANNLTISVTSFNGGYIGYITCDQWYHLNQYETRTMNWFGPQMGSYFTHIIKNVLEKLKV